MNFGHSKNPWMGVDFVKEYYNVSKFEAFGVASFMINPGKVLEDEFNH